MTIHPSAIIDPSAKIAMGANIGPYAIIGPQSVIGDKCKIHSHAVLEYVELGAGCEVYPFASIGLAPQHLGYKNEPTKLIVGENTIFRESVIVHRGTIQDEGVTRIGKNCFFMGMSHVAHDCRVGDNVIMANGAMLAGHVWVGDRTFISATAGIHQRVRIGKGAMVSGGSMVSLDVPPFVIVQGDRAVLRGLNVIGLRRSGANKESLRLLKNAYRVVFRMGLRLEEALANSIFVTPDPLIKEFKDFLSTPNRGFIRPAVKLILKDGEEPDA